VGVIRDIAAAVGSGTRRHPDIVHRLVSPAALAVAVVAAVIDPAGWVRTIVLGVAVATFAVWQRSGLPTPALAVGVLLPVAVAQVTGRLEPSLFLVALAAVVVARWEDSRWRMGVICVALIASPAIIVALQPSGNRIAWGIWVIGIAFSAVLGRGMHLQERLGRELDAARRQLAVQAQAEERRRIARDVHDLVGHGLAAVLLQVTSARHVLRRDLDAADEALASAEAVGRRSMQELRDTVTLLRDAGESGRPAPLPDIGQLGELVDAARRSGLRVEYRTSGDLTGIPPAVGLALYRIAQEALHNAARHAPRASTLVAVSVTDASAMLDVASVGIPAGRTDLSRPHYGLAGMGERAATVGGELQAGPTAQGWRVVARVPVPSA
jgi:signal transduction histidine kinase